jgi:hypothetical protein
VVDTSHIVTIISACSATIGIYEATGRGVRAAGRKLSRKITDVVKAELPLIAAETLPKTLNGRYPLSKDIYPRLERLEEAVEALPERVSSSIERGHHSQAPQARQVWG